MIVSMQPLTCMCAEFVIIDLRQYALRYDNSVLTASFWISVSKSKQ